MKATIKKEGHNTISINVLGFKPQIVSYEDFFSNTIFNSNKYCYVDSIEYEEASIVFNKIDPKYNHIFKDRYTISFELTNDEKFMKLLKKETEGDKTTWDELYSGFSKMKLLKSLAKYYKEIGGEANG